MATTKPKNEAAPPNADVEEVCNYLDALTFAREQLSDPAGLPLSMRLLNETHRLLLRGTRGATRSPGAIRRSQNWIGGSRPGNASFVPPPPSLLPGLLSDLERYVHADGALPAVARAGLLHLQFETLHPYLDGNGRIGRLLVTLLLEHWGRLSRPLLYLRLFFKRHRREYCRRLDAVRVEGDWVQPLAACHDPRTVDSVARPASIAARSTPRSCRSCPRATCSPSRWRSRRSARG